MKLKRSHGDVHRKVHVNVYMLATPCLQSPGINAFIYVYLYSTFIIWSLRTSTIASQVSGTIFPMVCPGIRYKYCKLVKISPIVESIMKLVIVIGTQLPSGHLPVAKYRSVNASLSPGGMA